jgi:hypothetical protein
LSANDCDYIYAENGLGKLALYSADKERDIIKFIEANKHMLQESIHQCGGVLLRNFNIRAVSEYSAPIESDHFFNFFSYRSCP